MPGPAIGTWYVRSEKDPRWNKSGKGYGSASAQPISMDNWLKKCAKKFGSEPDDLEGGFMKD